MPKYYHGTHEDNIPSILKEGLRPELSQRDDEPAKFAFLSHSPYGARAYGKVLEVNMPRSLDRKMVKNLGEFVRSPVNIPGKHISVFEGDTRHPYEKD